MRRSLKIIGIVLAVLLLLSGSIVGVLHLKSVQTYIAGKVAEQLSEMLEVDASIGSMHYRPLSQLTIDSVYLSDQERDTLAFIDQLQVKFYPLALRHQRINIEQLRLENPYINLQSRTEIGRAHV